MRALRYTVFALRLGFLLLLSIGRPASQRPHFTDIAAKSGFCLSH